MSLQVVLLLTALCGAGFGGWLSDGDMALTTPPALAGGVVGFLLGGAVARDATTLRRRIDEAGKGPTEAAGPTPAWPLDPLPAAMLALPVAAGALLWMQEAVGLGDRAARLLVTGTILATAVLAYLDARRSVLRRSAALAGARHPADGPATVFIGMLALWVLVYPAYFVGRWRHGGANLIVPGLVATAVFVGPAVAGLFADPELPPADSPEVVATLKRAVEEGPAYRAGRLEYGPLRVRGAAEVGFDRERQVRTGRATLVTDIGEEAVTYTVEWEDRRKGLWLVRAGGPP
jgi:hypothetical protein